MKREKKLLPQSGNSHHPQITAAWVERGKIAFHFDDSVRRWCENAMKTSQFSINQLSSECDKQRKDNNNSGSNDERERKTYEKKSVVFTFGIVCQCRQQTDERQHHEREDGGGSKLMCRGWRSFPSGCGSVAVVGEENEHNWNFVDVQQQL